MVFGEHPGAPLPQVELDLTARAALEEAIRPHLSSRPCLVSFSGGRDSSAVLAVATHVARRHGLPLPVPVTIRYRGAADADESAWQELVVNHLGLNDWVRIDVDDELDYLGPVATQVLRRHGLMWPPSFHYHQPMLAHASGGVLLTGHDGDAVFGHWRWARLTAVRRRTRRPTSRDIARLALAYAPTRVRRWASREPLPLSWLRPEAAARVEGAWAAERAGHPARWDRWLQRLARHRSLALGLWKLDVIARDCAARAVNPLLDPRFLAALARTGGRAGLGERSAVMTALFADLLPAEVLLRSDKARLGGGYWRSHSKAFVAEWDGHGIDEDLVDRQALREVLTSPTARPRSGAVAVLQGAWLAAAGGQRTEATFPGGV